MHEKPLFLVGDIILNFLDYSKSAPVIIFLICAFNNSFSHSSIDLQQLTKINAAAIDRLIKGHFSTS